MRKQHLSRAFEAPALLVWSREGELLQEAPSLMRPAPSPPIAKKAAELLSMHGHSRTDHYFWLKERENPEVLRYLEAENAYLERVMSPLESFKESLFQELKGRIQETYTTAAYRLDDYFYYSRYEEGSEYPIYCRRKGAMEAPEEVLADGNALGAASDYFAFNIQTSPNHQMAALIADTVGRRFYTLRFKDLSTGSFLPDIIEHTTGNMVWANDNKTIFYTRQHPQTLRSYRVYQHVLGTPASQDMLVYEEKDEAFRCVLEKSKSRKYIILNTFSSLSSESHVLEADTPQAPFRLVQPREKDHLYELEHEGDKFYIRTNLQAPNFKLVEAPLNKPGREQWRDVIPHRPDVLLEDFDVFSNFLVINEYEQGLSKIRIIRWQDQQEEELDFSEPAYDVRLAHNPDFYTDLLRIEYSSLTTPKSVYAYDMAGRERKLLKRQPVLGGFSPEHYRSERVMVTADDGARIPLSIVYHQDTPLDGSAPCLIYAYGSYGDSMEADFNASRLSLLNRGFVYAIAHIRGGQEMGRHWYEQGKLLQKKNSFTDFIACSEHLIREGYSASHKLFAMGGSAGGLLVSAVTNMRPDLYKGVIAQVPFVDVVTTMLDASIPLTTFEYEEWGNPMLQEYYAYMLSYSPYDNIAEADYPHMLVTTGLHDSQVQYWEPAKYVAKLREKKTDDNLLLLHTNMHAGHEGASGRFQALREIALEFSFLLELAGKADE